MAVTFPDAVSTYVISEVADPGTVDLTHTVTSGTTLLLCFVAANASEAASSITWGSAEQSLTKVADVDPSSSGTDDAGGSVWALVNPDVESNNFEVTSSTSTWGAWHIKAALNVHGTVTASVAAAISELSNDENTTATSTNVHASGGTSGNKLLFYGVGIGDDMTPASNDAGFTELKEQNSGGGAGNNQDGCIYIAEGNAPSAITVTWGASDENAGSLFEIVAASTTITGSGSADGILPTVSGTGERTVISVVTSAVGLLPTVAATGERTITGSGSADGLVAIVSGAGTVGIVITGSGSADGLLPTLAGVGERTITGSGSADGLPPSVSGTGSVPASSELSLTHYRWYQNDNADEDATTAFSAEDTSITTGLYASSLHLRVKVTNTGNQTNNLNLTLQQDVDDSGSWVAVSAESSRVRYIDGQPAQASITTERLTSTPGKNFVSGFYTEQDVTLGTSDFDSNEELEHVFSLSLVQSDLSGGEKITFRINDNTLGTVINSVIPTLFIESDLRYIIARRVRIDDKDPAYKVLIHENPITRRELAKDVISKGSLVEGDYHASVVLRT